jgi:predicted 3-demethylubiquinone-9 3-methyltransferase (glyoxalase superfamily)
MSHPKIIPHLWYSQEAEQAAQFYASVFPNSRIDRVYALPADTPGGSEGGSIGYAALSPSG